MALTVLLLALVASCSAAATAAAPGFGRNNDDNTRHKIEAQRAQQRLANALPASYIVKLKAAPLAAYRGGVSGLAATAAADGGRLDVTSAAAVAYAAHVDAQSAAVAAQAGVQPSSIGYKYQVTMAGFLVKNPSGSELSALRRNPNVARVERNEIVHTMTDASIRFLGLAGESEERTIHCLIRMRHRCNS
jgi:hypothetical protein